MPMIDIQEVGTGGGSIARVEVGNALRVGPESAGAAPGPVCYGLGGTEPTVTDANLVLGRLGADRFLGGEMTLDSTAAQARADRARSPSPLGLDPIEAADGILRIATTKMSHVVRWVTTERGLDAARLRAGRLRRRRAAARRRRSRASLRIGKVIIPRAPGHFSAYGMLVADLRRDFVNTWFTPLDDASFERHGGDLRRDGERRAARPSTRGQATRASTGATRARRHALRRPGACRHGRPADRAVRVEGPRRHQAALRRRAPDALRLLGRRTRRPRSSACAAP